MEIIESGINIRRHKTVTVGGRVGSGKSCVVGLLIDELLDVGKTVCYLDIDGAGVPKFDADNNNVRCFMYHKYEDIIDFYQRMNSKNKDIYIVVDGIGGILFTGSKSISDMYCLFFQEIRKFKNIKSIVSYNYNYNTNYGTRVNEIFRINSDFNIDIKREERKLYLNDEYLCNIDDLVLNPKIRRREKKLKILLK